MRFLSVADRELRAAARRSNTYYVRWISGIAFFGLLLWLLWVFNAFQNQRVVGEVLQVFSVLIFLYCLVVGTVRTADCLSSEKREGTLGLLYLTNLNSLEIVAGKLCSHALATVYGLLAIFPILALPLLMGGITFEYFGRTVLALLNTILFALAVGFVASAFCVRQFPAVATAMGIAVVAGMGLLGVAGIVDSYHGAKWIVKLLAVSCPFYPLLIADGSKMFGSNLYWWSLLTVTSASLVALLLVAARLARTWRDQPQTTGARRWWRLSLRFAGDGVKRDAGWRRRLLDVNPFYWLAGRGRVSSPVFMLLVVIIVSVTVFVTTPYFGRVMRAGANSAMIGSLFAWLWAGLAIHALSIYYAAMAASQRLAEDKQAGALEMILCTPTTEPVISRGLWLAYGRRMCFPVLCCGLVHFFFVWQVLIMAGLEPPGQMPRGIPAGELFFGALFNQPVRGHTFDWGFVFMFRILLLLLVLLVAVWITLGWVGRWLGLRMKHPGFAPVLALTLVFVPPILEFSFVCFLADKFHWTRGPERQFLFVMMWVAFGIGLGHCWLLGAWAAGRLRRDFRAVVTSRFQPPSGRRWWRPGWRSIYRFGLRTAALGIGVVLIVLSYSGCQSWRSRRAWTSFQAGLQRAGESLDFAKLLAGPVAGEENFAQAPVFVDLQTRRQQGLGKLLLEQSSLDQALQSYVGTRDTFEWTGQQSLPLFKYVNWFDPRGKLRLGQTNNSELAPLLLGWMQEYETTMRDLAAAARLPHLQLSTNRDSAAVLRPPGVGAILMDRVQFLFALRACARLDAGQPQAAGEDLLTSLEFARLMREGPDPKATLRVNAMLVRSCQPLWQGLQNHVWSKPQLEAVEARLARFNLLADYTNAVRRVVRAHIADWRRIPENPEIPVRTLLLAAARSYNVDAEWEWQPRHWWFDRCIQLYQAGERAIDRVDVQRDLVRSDNNDWSALQGLNLVDGVQQLILPYQYGINIPNPNAITFAETTLRQARLACGLELYWLAEGKYPPALLELVPHYLPQVPNDIMTGRPMIYQLRDDGGYVLRSTGPDQKDDRKLAPASSDDWIWAYPTNGIPEVTAPAK